MGLDKDYFAPTFVLAKLHFHEFELSSKNFEIEIKFKAKMID